MTMVDEVARDIKIPFRFRRKPRSIPPDLRTDWKVSLLLLILEISSRGGRSSLKRLHVLNWAVRSSRHQEEFEATNTSNTPLFNFNVRFEPAFSLAIDLAVAAGLTTWVGGDRLELTAIGRSTAKGLLKSKDFFIPEVDFLRRVGKSVTEAQAVSLLKGADIA
jgi:hypothetical protein